MKGELFNTDMVRALLGGRKTRTSRPIKLKYNNTHFEFRTDKYGTEFVEMQNNVEGETWGKNPDGSIWQNILGYTVPKHKYAIGDIMYVRETWCAAYDGEAYFYFADRQTKREQKQLLDYYDVRWHPSIHMPKEAARMFFRVTDVKVQNIADITEEDAVADGFQDEVMEPNFSRYLAKNVFGDFWEDQYGKDMPWMWVYYLKLISREEALG